MPDNMRYWQFFGSDKQIEIFLQSKDEFEDNNVDMDCEEDGLTNEQSTEEKQTVFLETIVLDVNTDVSILDNKTIHNT